MRILIINASDIKGGAAQVGWNIATGMRARGHLVTILCSSRSSEAAFVKELPKSESQRRTFGQRLTHRFGINKLALTSRFPKALDQDYFSSYDAIHLHDLPAAWNLSHLPWLTRQAPTAWTLHTMAPFTGNCLYSHDCDRYQNACGRCPQFGHWPLKWDHRDGSRLNIIAKRRIYDRCNLQLVGVSDWITQRARLSSPLRNQTTRTIPNAVDPQRFFPIDRAEARAKLGVPAGASTVLLAVSGNPEDTRKGLDIATAAIPLTKTENIFLLPLGVAAASHALTETLDTTPGLQPHHASDDETLRTYYAAADVIWHPSRADTSSMVSLEAMACGTPIIAAPSGGVPEVVDSSCAIILDKNTPENLATATDEFFSSSKRQRDLRSGALGRASTYQPFESFLDQHEELYGEMTA